MTIGINSQPIIASYGFAPDNKNVDRRFFSLSALALAIVTFVGFAPTYYLSHFTKAPSLGMVVHIHGIVFSAWMLFFLLQTVLVASGRRELHRVTGTAGAVLAFAVIASGITVAIQSGHLGHGPPDRNQPVFLIFPLTLMVLFAVFVTLGFLNRMRSAYHKRYMLLATVALATTPLARISGFLHLPFKPNAIGGIIFADVFLLAMLIFDLKKLGRIHPVTLWAGSVFFLSGPFRVIIGHTQIWQDFARYLIK